MNYSRRHLADRALLQAFHARDTQERSHLAELLADLGEIEVRRLYAPAGYSSLFDYCVRSRNWSEDMAGMRLRVARVGRKFPALLDAIADGRLHLTGAFLIAKKMNRRNGDELISAAANQSKAAVARMLAARYPQADVPQVLRTITASTIPSPERFNLGEASASHEVDAVLPVPERSEMTDVIAADLLAPIPCSPQPPRSRVTPLSATTHALQVTMRDPMYDKLQRFAALAGHRVPAGDLAALFEYALDLGIAALEKRKFATTDRPRTPKAPKPDSRHIPADVRRRVWKRDGGRCTFVSTDGHRCEECRRLEFDHIVPFARGGRSTLSNLRLRCRTHNQFEAERAFGVGFMDQRRCESQKAAATKALAQVAAAVEAANGSGRTSSKDFPTSTTIPRGFDSERVDTEANHDEGRAVHCPHVRSDLPRPSRIAGVP